MPELLGFVIGPFADNGGVGVDFEVAPVFSDPYLQKIKLVDKSTMVTTDQPRSQGLSSYRLGRW